MPAGPRPSLSPTSRSFALPIATFVPSRATLICTRKRPFGDLGTSILVTWPASMPATCTLEPLVTPSRLANSVYSSTWCAKASWRLPTRKIPRANNAVPAMMKIPTARYRLGIASLRNESASDVVFALAYFFDRSKGHEISLVENGYTVGSSPCPVPIERYDDQGGPVLRLAAHEKFIDFGGCDAIQPAARFISKKNL